MYNLIQAEWFKLRKDRSFRTIPLLIIGAAVLLSYFSVQNVGAGAFIISKFYKAEVMGFNIEMIKLFPSILAGFFISGEYAMGTMKSVASSGNIRMRLYWAKLAVFSIGAMIIALILPFVATGASSVISGFNSAPDWLFLAQTTGLYMLYAASFASIMAVISTIFTESGKAIGFLLMFFVFFDELLYVLSSKLSFIEPIWNYSVFKLVLDLGSIRTLDGGQWFTLLAVPVLTYVLFGLLGSWIFHRKEIK
ncbi:ABC transporter permease [Paenibacillus sp. MMS18-CY102]|uniref:ABC transporter permease n=1 Tax=Paenibacillus sp. MMS18-CY102 TaxID=2682849 RepID=UPI001365F2A9|nr:ABC transporter permease [Paenibacillus sp. MMS18-CY102]MWC30219.1 ABC transporter permease subunit [Paenibacillus sp. MMS18-CY102]